MQHRQVQVVDWHQCKKEMKTLRAYKKAQRKSIDTQSVFSTKLQQRLIIQADTSQSHILNRMRDWLLSDDGRCDLGLGGGAAEAAQTHHAISHSGRAQLCDRADNLPGKEIWINNTGRLERICTEIKICGLMNGLAIKNHGFFVLVPPNTSPCTLTDIFPITRKA